MKREIKFRGLTKNREENKWLYGSLITGLFYNINTKEDSAEIADPDGDINFDCMADFDDMDISVDIKTVGQYTGLKDKNGVEIYEGDILEGDNSVVYIVEFDNGSFIGKVVGYFRGDKQEWDKGYSLRDFQLSSISVIGNIHQNPELL